MLSREKKKMNYFELLSSLPEDQRVAVRTKRGEIERGNSISNEQSALVLALEEVVPVELEAMRKAYANKCEAVQLTAAGIPDDVETKAMPASQSHGQKKMAASMTKKTKKVEKVDAEVLVAPCKTQPEETDNGFGDVLSNTVKPVKKHAVVLQHCDDCDLKDVRTEIRDTRADKASYPDSGLTPEDTTILVVCKGNITTREPCSNKYFKRLCDALNTIHKHTCRDPRETYIAKLSEVYSSSDARKKQELEIDLAVKKATIDHLAKELQKEKDCAAVIESQLCDIGDKIGKEVSAIERPRLYTNAWDAEALQRATAQQESPSADESADDEKDTAATSSAAKSSAAKSSATKSSAAKSSAAKSVLASWADKITDRPVVTPTARTAASLKLTNKKGVRVAIGNKYQHNDIPAKSVNGRCNCKHDHPNPTKANCRNINPKKDGTHTHLSVLCPACPGAVDDNGDLWFHTAVNCMVKPGTKAHDPKKHLCIPCLTTKPKEIENPTYHAHTCDECLFVKAKKAN